MIQNTEFGRVEVRNIPLPTDMEDLFGTYTYSGRVLVTYHLPEDREQKDWFNVATINDDGTGFKKVFNGVIPQHEGANGMRWMCFPDNKRIHLGDYIMECTPSIDDCEHVELLRVHYPDMLMNAEGVFCHWSEIIVSPDNHHVCWTTLMTDGAINYLAKLVRHKNHYSLDDVCVVSTTDMAKPDPNNPGYSVPLTVRGGEVKQFVHGGEALTMVGNGASITESVVQSLVSEEVIQITDTPGYEETTIFSPDERLGVVMSPRFSEKTNCAVFGLVPQPHSLVVRSKMINILYMYAVAGVRQFRSGNVGPALIDVRRSRDEGRAYRGVDLSDPEGLWVYYSPISWHPDSKRALWNERTRTAAGPVSCRLRVVQLHDYEAGETIPAVPTPSSADIPYAQAMSVPKSLPDNELFPIKIKGQVSGEVINRVVEGTPPIYETVYDNFSDDGKTVYDGTLSVIAPPSMFAPGKTVFEADLVVRGEHNGEMKMRAEFRRDGIHAPAMLCLAKDEDGLALSSGYARYDGVQLNVEDMEP